MSKRDQQPYRRLVEGQGEHQLDYSSVISARDVALATCRLAQNTWHFGHSGWSD